MRREVDADYPSGYADLFGRGEEQCAAPSGEIKNMCAGRDVQPFDQQTVEIAETACSDLIVKMGGAVVGADDFALHCFVLVTHP